MLRGLNRASGCPADSVGTSPRRIMPLGHLPDVLGMGNSGLRGKVDIRPSSDEDSHH